MENSLGQLEKAELKAAKEARQRLDLERIVRRFKNPSGGGAGTSVGAGASVDEYKERDGRDIRDANSADDMSLRSGRQSISGSTVGALSARSTSHGAFQPQQSNEVQQVRPPSSNSSSYSRELRSYDGNSAANGANMVVEDLNATQDLRQSGSRNLHAAPVFRPQQQFRSGTPDSISGRDNQSTSSRLLQPPSSAGGGGVINSTHIGTANAARFAGIGSSAGSANQNYTGPAESVPRRFVPNSAQSVSSTIRSVYSTPNRSPEAFDSASGVINHNNNSGHFNSINADIADGNLNANSATNSSNSAFNRAFMATSRIEQAMKAKGWKLNK